MNADVLKFYELKETTDAVKFIVKNADLLGVADIDKNFLSANDTYKSSIAEYIRKKVQNATMAGEKFLPRRQINTEQASPSRIAATAAEAKVVREAEKSFQHQATKQTTTFGLCSRFGTIWICRTGHMKVC